ncbi:hypothetical protein LPB86_15365 [Pedobacter sp. MC2016-14]|uniref:hypothetical protein n=1 Tax=Pedobacter sp. MC2016-14 TaxID=2897327 RepID=UPI001E62243A|nr:hypothetical protein [Pedobacter sp. MC2016-14]MCD0489620.1 hypothetical protein [Pedobacter sp. MC2016-14]
MKNILTLIFIAFTFCANAQSDTSAYQTQRLKINSLLAERSAKFDQYEASLNERTGIFGFQTKSDIRHSNEILREITLNDNNIFKELKVLMDYKDLQTKQIESNVSNNEGRLQSYMLAIKKLQEQNQTLREEVKKMESAENFAWYVVIFLILLLIGISFLGYRKLKYK